MVIEDIGTDLWYLKNITYAYKMYKPGYLCTLLYEGIGSSKKQIWPEKRRETWS